MAKWKVLDAKKGWKMRLCPDGEVEIKRKGSIRKTKERNERFQRESKRKPSFTEAKGGFMRMIASHPEDVEQEIIEKCGHDEDKRALFFRDHPEFLVVPPSQAGIPPQRATIPVGANISQHAWDRIFPQTGR